MIEIEGEFGVPRGEALYFAPYDFVFANSMEPLAIAFNH